MTGTPAGWPPGVEVIDLPNLKRLGIDKSRADRGLFWDGKQVEIRSTFSLSKWQTVAAFIGVLGALGAFASGVKDVVELFGPGENHAEATRPVAPEPVGKSAAEPTGNAGSAKHGT